MTSSSCKTTKVISENGTRISPSYFGAKANDKMEDTEAFQKTIDHAYQKEIDTIFITEGTYMLRTLFMYPGLTFIGEENTVLKKVEMAGKWSRMFTTHKLKYLSEKDSKPIVFRNLNFDGNKDKQGPYKDYELQQQHLIFFDAHENSKGRLRGDVADCIFKNSVADAISIYRNADVKVSNCEAWNVFRGGVVVTGGNSKLHCVDFKAGGLDDVTGIDIEIDGKGYKGTYATDIYLKNVFLEGDFDIIMPSNGKCIAENVQVTGEKFYILAKDKSSVVIKNSSFVIGSYQKHRIYFPDDILFSNCNFTVRDSRDSFPSGLLVMMETRYRRKGGHRLRFNNCRFRTEGKDASNKYAIYNQENFTDPENNILSLADCSFNGDYKSAIYFYKGGKLSLDNIYLEKGTLINVNTSRGIKPLTLLADYIHLDDEALNLIEIGNNGIVEYKKLDNLIISNKTKRNFDLPDMKIKNLIFLDNLDTKKEIIKKNGLISKSNYRSLYKGNTH